MVTNKEREESRSPQLCKEAPELSGASGSMVPLPQKFTAVSRFMVIRERPTCARVPEVQGDGVAQLLLTCSDLLFVARVEVRAVGARRGSKDDTGERTMKRAEHKHGHGR